ncbi:hypothetical protein D3C75_1257030 [compost metagenome]
MASQITPSVLRLCCPGPGLASTSAPVGQIETQAGSGFPLLSACVKPPAVDAFPIAELPVNSVFLHRSHL